MVSRTNWGELLPPPPPPRPADLNPPARPALRQVCCDPIGDNSIKNQCKEHSGQVMRGRPVSKGARWKRLRAKSNLDLVAREELDLSGD
jgi:hypothetical protein